MALDRELCIRCDDETGKSGRADDSLYLAEYGPYCEECYPSYAADDLSDRIADLEQRIRIKDSENARLRALLDERTALLRDMASFRRRIEFAYDNATTADEVKDGVCDVLNDTTDHIRRIAATLKETTCDS